MSGRTTPTVVGLDLSLTAAGVAVIRPDGTIRVGTLGEAGHKGDTLTQRRQRILNQHARIMDWLGPDLWTGGNQDPAHLLFVIESPSFGSVHGHQHDRSGLWWWTVATLTFRWPLAEVAPTSRARYATGKGNAGKAAVLLAVSRRYPDAPITNDNEADALVLAAMGCRSVGHPIEATLPTAHLTAMDAVHWPTQEGRTA